MTKEEIKFNKGTATWKGKMLMYMTREELYDIINDLGELYTSALHDSNKE